MSPERWQQIKSLFESAIELPEGDRAVFLDQACAGDFSLRAEVESLLRADAKALHFFAHFADKIQTHLPAAPAEMPSDEGRIVGAYRLVREIGRGGMGVVYLAERADGQFEKQVAIKLIKRGMDSDAILQRFRRERQTLAQLDHPNITRLLDAGITEDGRPYFIMEYIDGLPIDLYCDTHQLDINTRLKLFHKVCAAVQYAHQRAIVHRDLKPSNILVTAEGEPKLVDFGIAKLLHPDSSTESFDLTMAGMRLLTLDYASPEQVRGEPITVASDVYSLGILLYKLLTGHHPYRFSNLSPQEIERMICEQEPEPLSAAVQRVVLDTNENEHTLSPATASAARRSNLKQLRRRFAGDLDNIAMKALRKEPQRRYASVEQFAEDIRRHWEGLPVLARKDTLLYLGTKFIKRHKANTIAVMLMVLLLAGMQAISRLLSPAHNAVPVPVPEVLCQIDPPVANYQAGSNHTVSMLFKVHGLPMAAVPVNFQIVSGPNKGQAASGTTNALGQASMNYKGVGGLGTDSIKVVAQYEDSSYTSMVQVGWFPPGTLFGPLGAPIGQFKKGDGINGGISCDGHRFSESVIEAHGQVAVKRLGEDRLLVQIELRHGDPNFIYSVEIFETADECGNSDFAATGVRLVSDGEGNGSTTVVLTLPYAPPRHQVLGDGQGSEAFIVVLDWVDAQKGGDRFSTDPMPLPAAR
jgi:serine/threonine protein kinase